MQYKSWVSWVGAAAIVCGLGACSSDSDSSDDAAAGAAGTAGTGGAGGVGGVGGTGGISMGDECADSENPMFGSCVESFIAGCYAPDLSGTCSSEDGVTQWSDGHRYDISGDAPGLYGPEDSEPCIAINIEGQTITATRGTETFVYEADTTTDVGTITCPDGSTFTATFDQVSAHNRCVGLECPDE